MAVQPIRRADPVEEKKKKAFDLKKFAKLGPLAALAGPAAGIIGGLNALAPELRAPALAIGGAAATGGASLGAGAGISAGTAIGGAQAGIGGIKAVQNLNAQGEQRKEGPAQIQTAPQRKVETFGNDPNSIIRQGLNLVGQLPEPLRLEAGPVLLNAFMKQNPGKPRGQV